MAEDEELLVVCSEVREELRDKGVLLGTPLGDPCFELINNFEMLSAASIINYALNIFFETKCVTGISE